MRQLLPHPLGWGGPGSPGYCTGRQTSPRPPYSSVGGPCGRKPAPSCFILSARNLVRSKLNRGSQTRHAHRLAGRGPPESQAHPGSACGRLGTWLWVCTRTLLPRCRAHVGAETGTRVKGRSQGLARPHSHLLQKQKWQPHQHGCDSSPGETAPAVAGKALAPTGPWQSALPPPLPGLRHHHEGAGGCPATAPCGLEEQGQARLLGPTKVGGSLG